MCDCIYSFWFDNEVDTRTPERETAYWELKELKEKSVEYIGNYAKRLGVDYHHFVNYNTPEDITVGNSTFGRCTYDKFFIGKDLLEEYDRVVYIDLDFLVLDDKNVFDNAFPFINMIDKKRFPDKFAFKPFEKLIDRKIDVWLDTRIMGLDRSMPWDEICDIDHINEFIDGYFGSSNIYPSSEPWISYLYHIHNLHMNRFDDSGNFFHPRVKSELKKYLK